MKSKKTKTITVCASASFVKEVLILEEELKKLGYKVLIPITAYEMKKKNDYNVGHYKTWFKNSKDYKIKTKLMNDHFKKVIKADAILVVNNEKRGLAGYIGGNTLMEMTLAYYFKKPIFILNEISNKLPIKEEVLGVNPIFLKGSIKNLL
ncbi:MAG: hypothetical protein HY424_02615 [Candidatus Levybacteria bacterium]|nr:hypothetical protein [Candidatus Levybacteria bacterium]